MKTIAIIPARYQSTRFPGKPLALINGRPMIQWVFENVSKASGLDEVYVASDDQRIYETVIGFGGKALMTSPDHTCGSDRLAECAEILGLEDDDIILNIQGDEPMIQPEMVQALREAFSTVDVYMTTLKKKIENNEELDNPNVVKVVTDLNGYALMFSRSKLPYDREKKKVLEYFKHIGAYGYKKWFLVKYSSLEKTPLEQTESLEQLRVLEHGYRIKVAETNFQSIGVDTPEQLDMVEKEIIKKLGGNK